MALAEEIRVVVGAVVDGGELVHTVLVYSLGTVGVEVDSE